MLRSIILEKPYWSARDSKFVYWSREIQRVLGMDLPAAMVIRLPSIASPFEPYTHILVYFPQSGKAMVFDCTINDVKRKYAGCDIKFYGLFDAWQRKHVATGVDLSQVKIYNYAVELCPFLTLHSSPCPDKTLASFMIDCEASAGVTGIEVLTEYDNNNRESESVELRWFHGGNECTLEFQPIAKWLPERDLKNKVLTWKSDKGLASFFDRLPHINNYHSKD